jgi:hypothetical protein
MNLKDLSNQALLAKLKTDVCEERALTTQILHYLLEVEARYLFAELGFSSLYDFCTRELGYCEGSAHLRISAMRFLKILPTNDQKTIERKLESGELSLSNISLLQKFVKIEEKARGDAVTADEKMKLTEEIENKSKCEAEKLLTAKNPNIINHEKERVLNAQQTQITFVASEGLLQKLNRVQALAAATNPHFSYADLFEKLVDFYLKAKDPLQKKEAVSKKMMKPAAWKADGDLSSPANENVDCNANLNLKQNPHSIHVAVNSTFPERSCSSSPETALKKSDPPRASRYIPASVKQAVWQRDQGRCTYRDDSTGNSCNSEFGLELDHIQPFALGGANTIENLRLRCKTHNLLHSFQTFGRGEGFQTIFH